jgi:hypothetical protein
VVGILALTRQHIFYFIAIGLGLFESVPCVITLILQCITLFAANSVVYCKISVITQGISFTCVSVGKLSKHMVAYECIFVVYQAKIES